MTFRVNEYYDLFDVLNATPAQQFTGNTGNDIAYSFDTNPFLGFSNGPLTQSTTQVGIKHFAAGAKENIRVDPNGDIWCFPPDVHVSYWSRVIFRNFDYTVQPAVDSAYKDILGNTKSISFTGNVKIPKNTPLELGFNLYNSDGTTLTYTTQSSDPTTPGGYIVAASTDIDLPLTTTSGTIKDYEFVPVFLKFDEYPSHSKVIFSQCDKTRNPDVEFTFGYPKGTHEPVKLNISLSANTTCRNNNNIYNRNLNATEMEKLFKSCYWSIEWQSQEF